MSPMPYEHVKELTSEPAGSQYGYPVPTVGDEDGWHINGRGTSFSLISRIFVLTYFTVSASRFNPVDDTSGEDVPVMSERHVSTR